MYGKEYWRWKTDNGKGNNGFAFAYTNSGDEINWDGIKSGDYYRTELAGGNLSQAGGKVFARNTGASKKLDGKEVYIVKDITKEITDKIMPLYFYDFTGNVTTQVKVVYSSDSEFSAGTTESVVMNGVTDFSHLFTAELEKAKIDEKPYVKFTYETDGSEKQLGEIYYFGEDGTDAGTGVVPVIYKAGSVDTFLYGATELKNDGGTTTTIISSWGTTPGNESLKDEILYFDNQHFPVEGSQEVTLQIGTGDVQKLIPDPQFKDSLYSYTFTNEATTQQTVLTVKDSKGNIYHFFWTDLDCNLLQVTEDNIANVTGEYGYGNKIYFDATYSKLNTPDTSSENKNDKGTNSIPASDNAKVYFYAWSSDPSYAKVRYGAMIKAKPHEKDDRPGTMCGMCEFRKMRKLIRSFSPMFH